MRNIYRITSPGNERAGVSYAKSLADADYLASVVVGNGYEVNVQRLKLSQVPMSEIHLVP